MKHLILSHADLDGIVSVINVWNIIKNKDNFQYMLTGYTSLEKKLSKLHRETYDILWILDLNIAEEYIHLLPKDKKIIWIDHHNYEYDVKSAVSHLDIIFVHDKSKSASLLTYEFLTGEFTKDIKTFIIPEKVKELTLLTDVYDMWRKDSPDWKNAYDLNDLYWHYNYEKFFTTFRDGYEISNEDYNNLILINSERIEYVLDTLKKYTIHNEEHKIAYLLNPACKHTNYFTLIMTDIDYYIILKEWTDKIFSYSVRLYNNDLNLTVQDIFGKVKEDGVNVIVSGGHARVGSITVSYEDNEKFLESINTILEGRKQNE